MITLTLGTTPYPFGRALQWMHQLLEQEIITEPVFVQHGSTDIALLQAHERVSAAALLTAPELNEKISQSRLVISHAGQGSTRKLAAQNKSFVILPRLAKYEEHVDDHQLRFAEGVEQLGVTVCRNFDTLKKAVVSPPEPLNRELFSGPKLGDFLAQKYAPERVRKPVHPPVRSTLAQRYGG
ncbi:MAG: glycosyltransferase [Cyanobacteria bacterium J06597_16]